MLIAGEFAIQTMLKIHVIIEIMCVKLMWYVVVQKKHSIGDEKREGVVCELRNSISLAPVEAASMTP